MKNPLNYAWCHNAYANEVAEMESPNPTVFLGNLHTKIGAIQNSASGYPTK